MNIKRIRQGIYLRQKFLNLGKEIFRKSIHICSAFVPLLLFYARTLTLILLSLAIVFYSLCEIFRLKGIHVPVISTITTAAARKRDENKFVLGPVTLCIGILLSALIWDWQSASAGIFALAFGDGTASLAGKMFGKIQIPLTQGKTAAGSLTCFAAIFISTFIFLNFRIENASTVALILASIGMLIEVLPLKDLDNIIIPVIIGGLCQFLC